MRLMTNTEAFSLGLSPSSVYTSNGNRDPTTTNYEFQKPVSFTSPVQGVDRIYRANRERYLLGAQFPREITPSALRVYGGIVLRCSYFAPRSLTTQKAGNEWMTDVFITTPNGRISLLAKNQLTPLLGTSGTCMYKYTHMCLSKITF